MKETPKWRLDAPSGLSLAAAAQRHGPASGPRAALRQIIRPEAQARWRGTTVGYYTPQMVDLVLRSALMGDLASQWELFDLMEDTWPRLAKNLGEIKRAVAAMQWQVTAWSEEGESPSAAAEERARLVSHCLWRMRPVPEADERNFTGLVYDLLDAWGKGISVNELIWEERQTRGHGRIFGIRGTRWVHPQHYALGSDGLLGLRMEAGPAAAVSTRLPEVEPFPPYKFVVGVAKARTAHFCGAALLRPLAWWWASANFAAQWLLNYAQLFGVPMRWANYAPGTDESVIEKINEALAEMGSAAWASFPEGTTLQTHEGSKTHGTSPQEGILDRADRQCDLLVLGQTLTSDATSHGTQALGTVHERVRGDVLSSAADWAGMVLSEQLVPAVLELNYGDAEEAPEIRAQPVREEDRMGNAQRDEILLRSGVPMPRDWFYQRHEIPLPKPGEETIGRVSTEAPGRGQPPDWSLSDLNDLKWAARAVAGQQVSDPAAVAGREMSELVERALAEGLGARRRWLAPLQAEIERVAAAVGDPERTDQAALRLAEAATRRLPELCGELDTAALAQHLTAALGATARAGAELGLDNRPVG